MDTSCAHMVKLGLELPFNSSSPRSLIPDRQEMLPQGACKRLHDLLTFMLFMLASI